MYCEPKSHFAILISILVPFGILILAGCTEPPSTPWPTDYSAVFTTIINDPTNDLVPFMPESPPYPVSYPPVDVTQISLGVQGSYLYIRIDCAGITPVWRVYIPSNPPIESQTVSEHGTNVGIDIDQNGATGMLWGIDMALGVAFNYGLDVYVAASYGFMPGNGDTPPQITIEGEWGQGGPGYSYVIARYNLLNLIDFSLSGKNVTVFSWAEAMSFDSNGNELYAHFAFDDLISTTWTIP